MQFGLELNSPNRKFFLFKGELTAEKKNNILQEWKNTTNGILLLSKEVGSLGLNLQEGNKNFHKNKSNFKRFCMYNIRTKLERRRGYAIICKIMEIWPNKNSENILFVGYNKFNKKRNR